MKQRTFFPNGRVGALSRWGLSLIFGIVIGSAPFRTVEARDPTVTAFAGKMTFQGGKLTARIPAASLWQVLEEVSRLSGARLLWLNEEGRDETVSVEFTDLLFDEALRRIIGGKNFLLVYSSAAQGRRLTQIWISSRKGRETPLTHPTEPLADVPAIVEPAVEDPPERDRLMEVAVHEQNLALRLDAISTLEGFATDDARVLGLLAHLARNDEESQVRTIAWDILARTQTQP